jgi:secondary thiamine-phosphate synthase enzyme
MTAGQVFSLRTQGFGDTIDITRQVSEIVEQSGITHGLVTVFCTGSTGTVTTIEFEPGVVQDLKSVLEKIVPSAIHYEHNRRWGDGNGFSHVRAALMKPSLTIPVSDARMTLGTWQQIVFIDFDNRQRERKVRVQIIGE